MNIHQCPLCNRHQCTHYFESSVRRYFQCEDCCLVFMDPSQRLSRSEEKALYDHHQNSSDDPAYRRFLSRLFHPMLDRLSSGANGLDFGCGPGPTLSVMFEERGFSVQLYDIYYFNDQRALTRHYDFITATEVVEHLFRPGPVLRQLWQQLEVGGVLGVMTKLVTDQLAFSSWHYKNDMSHVVFFSRETFAWLANELNASLTIVGQDVVLLTKQ